MGRPCGTPCDTTPPVRDLSKSFHVIPFLQSKANGTRAHNSFHCRRGRETRFELSFGLDLELGLAFDSSIDFDLSPNQFELSQDQFDLSHDQIECEQNQLESGQAQSESGQTQFDIFHVDPELI